MNTDSIQPHAAGKAALHLSKITFLRTPMRDGETVFDLFALPSEGGAQLGVIFTENDAKDIEYRFNSHDELVDRLNRSNEFMKAMFDLLPEKMQAKHRDHIEMCYRMGNDTLKKARA